jgi:hypothetical protein
LALGLLLMCGAVLLEVVESIHARHEMGAEAADLDDDVKRNGS